MKSRDKKEEEPTQEEPFYPHPSSEEVQEEISPENPCSPPTGEITKPKGDCH
jgi:hypothetical protein